MRGALTGTVPTVRGVVGSGDATLPSVSGPSTTGTLGNATAATGTIYGDEAGPTDTLRKAKNCTTYRRRISIHNHLHRLVEWRLHL